MNEIYAAALVSALVTAVLAYALITSGVFVEEDDSVVSVTNIEPTMCSYTVEETAPENIRVRSPHDGGFIRNGSKFVNSAPGGWITAEYAFDGETIWNYSVQDDCSLRGDP